MARARREPRNTPRTARATRAKGDEDEALARRRDAYARIYAIVDSVPAGSVATYGQVAREAGLPRGARQVGRALRELAPGSKLPWHRVVNAAGKISPRGDGSAVTRQRRLLRAEGVSVDARGKIDLARFRWRPAW